MSSAAMAATTMEDSAPATASASGYDLREKKKPWRLVISDFTDHVITHTHAATDSNNKSRFCKECGNGFHSQKILLSKCY